MAADGERKDSGLSVSSTGLESDVDGGDAAVAPKTRDFAVASVTAKKYYGRVHTIPIKAGKEPLSVWAKLKGGMKGPAFTIRIGGKA